jgi:hypothetical protein
MLEQTFLKHSVAQDLMTHKYTMNQGGASAPALHPANDFNILVLESHMDWLQHGWNGAHPLLVILSVSEESYALSTEILR